MRPSAITWTAAVLLASVFLSFPASAAIRPYSLYLHPHAGWYGFDADEDVKDSPLYGIDLGYRFDRNWSSEVSGTFIDAEAKSDGELAVHGYLLRLDFLYNFRPAKRLVPYLAAGFGGVLLDEQGGSTDLDGVVGYGLGLQYFIVDRVALRFDGRHLLTLENLRDGRDFSHYVASAGLLLEVGGEEERPAEVDTDGDGVIDLFDRCPDTGLGVPVDGYGCPVDGDRDGVPDFLDRCPATPAGTAVDRTGCPLAALADSDRDGVVDSRDKCPETPAGAVVDSNGCPAVRDSDADAVPDARDKCPGTPAGTAVDSDGCPVPPILDRDGDGVEDGRDRCPDTVAGTPVDPSGCPPDADGDGVPDHLDRCSATPAGQAVDTAGCPQKAAVHSLTLHLQFAPGAAELGPADKGRLQEAVDFIRANPGRSLVVEGHTDSVGGDKQNLELSRSRAESVRRYLLEQSSIEPGRIRAHGFGESQPVASNATPEGRLQNRRVIIRVE